MVFEQEHIIATVEFKSDDKEVVKSVNTVANVTKSLSSTFSRLMSANIALMSSTLSLVRAYRQQRDVQRELNRESARRYDLDVRQSRLNVEIAQRELMIARRSTRSLDIKRAELGLDIAIRDVSTTMFDVIDKKRRLREQEYDAEKNLEIVQLQRISTIGNIIAQQVLMLTTTIAVIVAVWKESAAHAVRNAIISTGLSLLALAAIVTTAVAIVKSASPSEDELRGGTPPGAQTRGGEVKKITREGLVNMHEGEFVGRGGSVSTLNIKVPDIHAANRAVNERLKRRTLGRTVTTYYTPMGMR